MSSRPLSLRHLALALGAAALLFAFGPTSASRAEVDKDKEAEEATKKPNDGLVRDGETHQELHERLEKESRENLAEITRLMEKIQGDLAQKNTGAATQETQKDTIKKLNELIEKVSKGCSMCSGGGGGGGQQQQQQQGSQGQQQQQQNQQNQQGQGEQQEQMARDEKMKPGEQQQGEEQQQQQQQGNKPESPGETENNQVSEGRLPPSKAGALLQKMMGTQQWGLLPKKLREDMGTSSAKEFPREYRDIISKYYKRMSEVLTER